MSCENILVLSIVEASLFHGFFQQISQIWAGISVSDHESVTNEKAGHSSFDVEVEREVEGDQVVDDTNGEILDKGVSPCLSLHELGEKRFIILAVVVAEVNSFFDFFLSVNDGFPHFEGDDFREFLEPDFQLFSNPPNEFSSFSEGSLPLYLEGGIRPVKFGLEFLFGEELKCVFDLPGEWVL